MAGPPLICTILFATRQLNVLFALVAIDFGKVAKKWEKYVLNGNLVRYSYRNLTLPYNGQTYSRWEL